MTADATETDAEATNKRWLYWAFTEVVMLLFTLILVLWMLASDVSDLTIYLTFGVLAVLAAFVFPAWIVWGVGE